MKAEFDFTMKIKIVHNIDTIKEVAELKTPTEMGTDIIGMIADECIMAGGIAVCEIIKSELNVK